MPATSGTSSETSTSWCPTKALLGPTRAAGILRCPGPPASAETQRSSSNGGQVTVRVVPPDVRVSSIELFFDLVFVFAITQLTTLLAQDPTILGLARAVLIFGNVWWMYGG